MWLACFCLVASVRKSRGQPGTEIKASAESHQVDTSRDPLSYPWAAVSTTIIAVVDHKNQERHPPFTHLRCHSLPQSLLSLPGPRMTAPGVYRLGPGVSGSNQNCRTSKKAGIKATYLGMPAERYQSELPVANQGMPLNDEELTTKIKKKSLDYDYLLRYTASRIMERFFNSDLSQLLDHLDAL